VSHQFGILEDQGHVTTRLREEVGTRMPRPEETHLLRLRPGVPVLDVWHASLELSACQLLTDGPRLMCDTP
jgi:hypothetical protein